MNGQELLIGMTGINSKFIEEAAFTSPARRVRKVSLRKGLLIAAAIVLCLALVGCTVVYVLRLSDLKIGQDSVVVPKHLDEQGNKIPETQMTRDVISLQGMEGSPTFRAARDWFAFTESYDPDHTLLNTSALESADIPAKYDAYFVYTQEMMDKVDQICADYGLEPAGQNAPFQEEENQLFFDSLALSRDMVSVEMFDIRWRSGYFYGCGNFKIEWSGYLADSWPHEVLGSLIYTRKGYFAPLTRAVYDAENCEQWVIQTKDGQDVLLFVDGDYATAYCEREDGFLNLHFSRHYRDENDAVTYMDNAAVQAIAEAFDFSIRPETPDMEEVNRKLEAYRAAALAEQAARAETYADPFSLESYREYAQYLMDSTKNPRHFYYGFSPDHFYCTIRDFNGDGVEDFLHGPSENTVSTVVTLRDGKIANLFGIGMDFYLCEDLVVEHSSTHDTVTGHYYFQIEEEGYHVLQDLRYDSSTGIWTKALLDGWNSREEITGEEAGEIIQSFQRIELNMMPIREFLAE